MEGVVEVFEGVVMVVGVEGWRLWGVEVVNLEGTLLRYSPGVVSESATTKSLRR